MVSIFHIKIPIVQSESVFANPVKCFNYLIVIHTYVRTYIMGMNIEERPNMKELLEMMRKEHIATKWYQLGAELLENNDHLEVIKVNQRNDVQSCCHEMFQKWLDVKPNASWSQLITALNNIEMTTAAVEIFKRYETGNKYMYVMCSYIMCVVMCHSYFMNIIADHVVE